MRNTLTVFDIDMHQELFIAIIAGLGGMIGGGLTDFFAKKIIDKVGDITTLFWSQLIGILPLLILFSFNPSIPRLNYFGWVGLLILGVWDGLSYIPMYIAFRKGKISLLSPILATYAVIVVILSAIFFDEIIPFGRQIAILIVFIGVLLINGDPRDIWVLITRMKRGQEANIKGLPEILLAVCLYSLWTIALDRFISDIDWVPIILIIRLLSTFSVFIYARSTKRKLFFKDSSLFKSIFLIGLFDVTAFGFVAYGFNATSYVSIVVMLSSAFSLPVIILGHFFLKERTTIIQTIGGLITIAGIMFLSLS